MKIKTIIIIFLLTVPFFGYADRIATVNSPDGCTTVNLSLDNGKVSYSVLYEGNEVIKNSSLGLLTSIGNLAEGLQICGDALVSPIKDSYDFNKGKFNHIDYVANKLVLPLKNNNGIKLDIIFQVSDNNVAFCYILPQNLPRHIIINNEITEFAFPAQITTTYISPQALPGSGWEGTKPSYEEEYTMNLPVGMVSTYGVGYTFPSLFKVGSNWVLVSETGVDSNYAGCRLSESSANGVFHIEFPQPGENNGIGSNCVAVGMPAQTAWRTITVGDNLNPIFTTTIATDVVKPKYEASQDYKFGKSAWSWIVWQDESINFNDQVKYIDMASQMGIEYVLVDGNWDIEIGYDKMADLAKYARSKNVDLWLWYNSNGFWNNAPQTPRQKMNVNTARINEMAWLKKIGVKGIKVDFFGGDKQETMKLYQEILTDANTFGLMVNFHGTTLPRGWERMFPNFVASESVLASENIYFQDYFAKKEVLNSTILPFTRNATAVMEFGGVFLNQYMSRDNKSRHKRYATDAYELASLVLYWCPIQFLAVTPNNLNEKDKFIFDFIRDVPTTWDYSELVETKMGEYCIVKRRKGNDWYIAGSNALKTELKKTIIVPELAGKTVSIISDNKDRTAQCKSYKVTKDGKINIDVLPDGGFVIKTKLMQ